MDETDIVNVQRGQPVRLKLDALPDASITGTVTRVALTPVSLDAEQSDQLVTYPVRVTLDSTDQPVRSGMSATTTIIVNELDNVLMLPNRFIRIDRLTQQAYATVERDGAYVEVPITLGLRNETDSQIVTGAAEGQRVVLLPRATFDIFNGQPPGR
jgi:HlyD family secretion protein